MGSENNRLRVYEGLILFDSKEASSRWDALKGQALDILKKHGAEVLRERKWSDRRLAYEIRRVRRGTYLLVHFAADPEAIVPMRKDFKLAESVLRELILRLDESVESYRARADLAELGEEVPPAESPPQAKVEDKPVQDKPQEASVGGETKV